MGLLSCPSAQYNHILKKNDETLLGIINNSNNIKRQCKTCSNSAGRTRYFTESRLCHILPFAINAWTDIEV